MAWVFLTLTYGLLKGARDIVKKKAMGKSSVMEVLFTYTLISFIMVLPDARNAMGLERPGDALYGAQIADHIRRLAVRL